MIRILFSFCLFFSTLAIFAQDNFTISGYVRDGSTGEDMIGSSVYVKETLKGVTTNVYGFYSLTVPAGNYTLVCTSIGFQNYTQEINLNQDLSINIELKNTTYMGKKVVVIGEKSNHTEGTQVGRESIEVDKIKTLPALLGEVDILKTIQLLPGIQASGEGNSGFFVRGGGADQNLILLDNAIVYNASHLFGFFSVFNADAIKDVDVIKGGMPANYGGRVSSVLDITMNEGNSKEFKVKGGLGLISSRLLLEGPIVKDKASFSLSARRTYADVLLKPFTRDAANQLGYYFYDVNMKMNFRPSDKNRFYLSAYLGQDVFDFASANTGFDISSPWGNKTFSARWNHLFNDKLFLNTTGTFTEYNYEFGVSQSDFNFKLSSGIRDWGAKTQLSYFPNPKHSIKAGVDYIFHRFTPSTVTASAGETEFDLGGEENIFSHEISTYIQDDFEITKRLKVHLGLRVSHFRHVGPYTKYTIPEEDDGLGPQPEPIVEEFEKGDLLKSYLYPEPRFNVRYTTGPESSVKASFTHNYQYLHLTSTSATSLPTDVWFPSTDRVEPQFAQQVSLGYFKNFFEGKFETSVEVYYKDLDNLIEFRPGARPEDNVNNNIDNNLVFGTGTSYGAEFFIKKNKGDITGWIAYTWSKTDRMFPDISNDPFPARFDRRHDLSIIADYKLNDYWRFGAAFVYATGNAITVPVARYFIEGRIVEEYGDWNGFRMPSFHRLDISATWYPKRFYKKQKIQGLTEATEENVLVSKRRIESYFVFSVYNAYNRQNPYFIFFGNEGNLQQGELDFAAIQVSLFPIIPSISWNFEF